MNQLLLNFSELVLVSVIQVRLWLCVFFQNYLTCMALFVADDNNTRVLFEKVLSSMPKDKARFVDQSNDKLYKTSSQPGS